jgi:succinate dehydrogenase / fumarate reductase flavoprotein subunit
MEIIKDHDIIIIGGGAAGMRAAISAAEENPKARIAIISKVHPVRSHTVCAEGGIAAPLKDYDSIEQHCFDTIKGSDYLSDQDAVEFFVKKSAEEILQLERWGCLWSRLPDGSIAVRKFGGMSVARTVYAADKTGFYIMHSLFERSLLYENIKRYDEWFVTKLLSADKEICGLTAIDMKNGKLAAFQTKVIIMATGGAGRIYGHTTNSSINTGDGMALALNAGAALKDMEMVQFHPTTLPNGNLLITEAARGEGGRLVNKNNERFLKKYLPEKMELGPRDLVTRAIISEINLGNAATGPHGSYVDLDIRHLGDKTIKEKLPTVRDLCLQYLNIDPAIHKIPVTPAQHYFMGGIAVNIDTGTTIPGLLAAGETACISIHGANRMGSNSLAECVVFGNQAGKRAAEITQKHKQSTISENQINNEEKRIYSILNNSNTESITDLKLEMQTIMDTQAGIIREEKTLTAGLNKIKSLRKRAGNINLHDKSMVFNTELTSLLELEYMLTICETVLTSAIERKESRGSHFRSDYPNRNDDYYLEHILINQSENKISLTRQPVKITGWQPAARAY